MYSPKKTDAFPARLEFFSWLAIYLLAAVTIQVSLWAAYLVNDNLVIVAAIEAGMPLPIVHWLLTTGLHLLHVAWPSIGWYPLLLTFTTALGLALLATAVPLSRTGRIIFGAALLALTWPYFARLDYTATSLMLAFGGFALLISRYAECRGGMRTAVLVGVVLAVAIMIRLNAPKGALVYALPAFAIALWAGWRERIHVGRPAMAIGMLAVLVLLVYASDTLLKRHAAPEGYAAYETFYLERGWFQKRYESAPLPPEPRREMIRAAGWTKQEFENMRHWIFFRPELRDPSRYSAARAFLPWKFSIIRTLQATANVLQQKRELFLFGLAMIVLTLRIGAFTESLSLGIAIFAALAVLTGYLESHLGMDGRVQSPMLIGGFSLFAIAGCAAARLRRQALYVERYRGLAFLLCAILLSISMIQFASNQRAIRNTHFSAKVFERAMAATRLDHDDTVLFQPDGRMRWQSRNAYSAAAFPFTTVSSGWISSHPMQVAELRRLDGSPGVNDFPEWLVDNHAGWVVARKAWAKRLARMASRKDARVMAIKCEDLHFDFALYRLTSARTKHDC